MIRVRFGGKLSKQVNYKAANTAIVDSVILTFVMFLNYEWTDIT